MQKPWFCLLLFASSISLGQTLLIPHITPSDSSFSTKLQITGQSHDLQNFSLVAYDSGGNRIGDGTGEVNGAVTQVLNPNDFFDHPQVSHVVIEEANQLAITVIYQANTTGSGPAHTSTKERQASAWKLFPGNAAVTWDGIAVVNMGSNTTDVRVDLLNGQGTSIDNKILASNLVSMGKALFVLSRELPAQGEDNAYLVSANEPLTVFALRGDLASNFLWENPAIAVTAPVDDTLTSDFVPPTGEGLTDPDEEGPGHFRILLARSDDGLNFTSTGQLFTDQGNVPDMVQTNDGTLYLYYTGWNVGGRDNVTAVGISKDNGETWVYKYLDLVGYPNNFAGVDPDVILMPDGSFRMYMTSGLDTGNIGIYYGESTDGLLFNGVATAAQVPGRNVLDSNTFQIGNTWHMYALNSQDTQLWHFTSSDGLDFSLMNAGPLRFNNNDYTFSNGFHTENGYRAFLFFLPEQDLLSAISTDGSQWTLEEGTRLSFQGGLEGSYLKDPAVIKLQDGSYLMAYVTRFP